MFIFSPKKREKKNFNPFFLTLRELRGGKCAINTLSNIINDMMKGCDKIIIDDEFLLLKSFYNSFPSLSRSTQHHSVTGCD